MIERVFQVALMRDGEAVALGVAHGNDAPVISPIEPGLADEFARELARLAGRYQARAMGGGEA